MRKNKKKKTSNRAHNAHPLDNLNDVNIQVNQLPPVVSLIQYEGSGSICASSSGAEQSWKRVLATYSSEDDVPNNEQNERMESSAARFLSNNNCGT